MAEQTDEFKPKIVYLENSNKEKDFKKSIKTNCKVVTGEDKLIELARRDDYDMLIVAVVGFYGLLPTIEAIKAKKRIAIANKETLVVAGKFVRKLLKEYKTELLPIDSEHSAILQCLAGEEGNDVSKIFLTASGGPFRSWTKEQIKDAKIEDALNHPNWVMGNKITVDSATMMNKGLEVIEAKWLFDIELDKIEVLIHPQSIIHSMVEFTDGSIKAQLGMPDMKIPIQYAITHPHRVSSNFPRTDFFQLSNLTFEKPDFEKFECLNLAYQAMKHGGTYPVVLNAANEVAVGLFLEGKIGFSRIAEIIKKMLFEHKSIDDFELEHIYEVNRNTRNKVNELI